MSIPTTPIDTVRTGTGANLFFYDGLNTRYVVAEGKTVLGHSDTWKGAAVIRSAKGGRIRLNGKDITLLTFDPECLSV
jgi:hypothetical protein